MHYMKLGKTLRILSAGVLVAAAMISCTEHVDTSARYVFEDETVYSYLSKHPVYSEYVDLWGKVKVSPSPQGAYPLGHHGRHA